MFSLKETLWRYHRLIAILIAVIIVNIFELALLHYKYDIFTGGFLQPFAYKTISERFLFIFLSLLFDLSLCGVLASFWFFIADKFKKKVIIVSYNFTVLIVLLMGIWLSLKFKVLSYFSNTINFTIIKNLGGGSLKEAFLYADFEIALFVGIASMLTVAIFFGKKLLEKSKFVLQFHMNPQEQVSYSKLFFPVLIVIPILTFFVSNNDFLRYGLEKKTSYLLISSVLDQLSDIDSDGFGSFLYPKDKAEFNAAIYPGALDIPGNGIDEDGFLGDATVTNNNKDSLSVISPKGGKHIVLIVLESARADLLDKQLSGQYVAPVMREIAKKGTSIKYAYSHTGYTASSLKAIFNRELVKDKDTIGLIEFLQSAGYQLSIISGQDESFGDVASEVGMKKEGVNYFDARTAINDRVFPSRGQSSLRLSEERVIKQLQTQVNHSDFTKPQFFYLNFQAAHFPYSNPKMTKRIIQDLIPRSDINEENKNWVAATYWNAIANADWAVGKVIEILNSRNLIGHVTIVILGDHGESLFDDGFLGHGHAINDIQTRIPLISNDPNIVVNEPIGQVDVAEMTIRSGLGLTNNWTNKDKVVFQFVGSLSQPALIAHVNNSGVRTLFDFRSEQVFFSDLNSWKSYQEALSDPSYKERVVNLIREWEALRWNEHTAENS